MNKFKGLLLLSIIVSLVLISVGCTNNQVSELESQISSYQQDITAIKHYSRIQLYYDRLLIFNNDLLDDLLLISDTNRAMDTGLDEGYIKNELSIIKDNIDNRHEDFDFLEDWLASIVKTSDIQELELLDDAENTLVALREIMLFLDDAYLVISDFPRLEIWNDDVLKILDELYIHADTTVQNKKISSKSLEIYNLIQDF